MKTRDLLLPSLLAALVGPLTACSGGDGDTSGETNGTDTSADEVCDAPFEGTITEDTVWTCDKSIEGQVVVENNAVLTIEPGVTIQGRSGSALLIQKGSRLEAVGTPDMPIVFTSSQAEGSRARGDWGGIVFLGDASTNLGSAGQAEGLQGEFAYGGSDDGYNCGTLQYVRVEFAGFELTTDNELNGITFYACGSGTTLDHVQVHMGQDDGIEWFGGTFDADHLIVTGALDDSFDIDQGFRGTLEYLFVQQDPSIGNYAFEISNQGTNLGATPRTAPYINWATAIGSGGAGDTKSAGVKFKEGTNGEIHNSIITNFDGAQVDLTEPETETEAEAGNIKIQDNLFWDNGKSSGSEYQVDEGSDFDLKGWVEMAENNNQFVDPMLTSVAWGAPNIVPDGGSPALAGATQIGAVSSDADNFTAESWTNYADK